MSALFGFDPSKFSDDELLQRQTELHSRLVWAARFASGDMVEQLQIHLAAVETERRERFLKTTSSARNAAMSDVIETEPDLREETAKQTAQTDTKSAPRRRPALVRSSRPIQGDDPDAPTEDKK